MIIVKKQAIYDLGSDTASASVPAGSAFVDAGGAEPVWFAGAGGVTEVPSVPVPDGERGGDVVDSAGGLLSLLPVAGARGLCVPSVRLSGFAGVSPVFGLSLGLVPPAGILFTDGVGAGAGSSFGFWLSEALTGACAGLCC